MVIIQQYNKMTTYSFIKYDVLKDIMYFKSTPTPDFKQQVKTGGISTEQDREVIEGIQATYNNLIPQDAFDYIKSYLEAIPELDLNNSKNITLKVEIDEDTNEVGTVLIVSQNTNRTLTTINVPTNDWPTPIASKIKLPVKYPTLAKCGNCLKFTFGINNEFNFVGNLGGQWDGSFRNGQKVYQFNLPDYSNPNTYGNTTDYRIFWKPNITGTFSIYGGGTLNINNEAKWIAVPSSSIGTVNELSNTTFFHALSNTSASCPFTPNPTNSGWNFRGDQGFFLLELSQTGVTELGATKCPQFIPTPGDVDWGYNCGPNGCVEALSGSVGTYATLTQCQASCSIETTQSFEYRCTFDGCQPIPSGSGGFATLAECEANCVIFPPEPPFEYVCNIEGVCVEAPSGSGGYLTIAECEASCSAPPPPPVYEYNCTPNGCVQVPSGSGSYATLAECEATCNIPVITECNCSGNLVSITNSNFSSGFDSWTYSPNPTLPGVGGWSFIPNKVRASVQENFNSVNVSNVYLSQLNVLTVSCSYEICFQAWSGTPGMTSSFVSVDTGNYTTNLPPITPQLTTTPTAYTLIISNTQTPDLTFFLSSPGDKIFIDGICVKQTYCPPPPPPTDPTGSELCIITGSTYCYEDIEYDCTCPAGYTSDGSGSCIADSPILVHKQLTSNGGLIPTYLNVDDNYFFVRGSGLWGRYNAVLYYNYNPVTGLPTSSIGTGSVSSPENPSPYFGDSRVFNSAYTFDWLKQPFWRNTVPTPGTSETISYASLSGFAAQLMKVAEPIPAGWYGGGSFLNVTSSKTYYVGLMADDLFRFTISGSSGIQVISPTNTGFNGLNNSVYPQRNYGTNPYLPWNGSSYNSSVTPGAQSGGNMSYGCLHIYPIQLDAGCYYVKLEADDTNSVVSGLGGVIFDMTGEEILNASSSANLNIIWDSRTDLLYSFSNGITASCPPGSTPLGSDNCDLCEKSIELPCGNCVECFNGLLYNSYVVDAGSPHLKGRGNGGIVCTAPLLNPINTWVIPDQNDWNTLITYLNGFTPSNLTPSGSYGVTSGGKMKDYTRDTIASCWNLPNIGAQTDEDNSGWAGTASGRRLPTTTNGIFEGLGFDGYWWVSNSTNFQTNPSTMAVINLKHWSNDVYRYEVLKNHGCSIRLVRPAEPGEVNGTIILDAYVGTNNKSYDGIVIGTQVWLTKNLSETQFNNGFPISTTVSGWTTSLSTAAKRACYYNDNSSNNSILKGNIDPSTGLCYEYPTWFVYKKCGGTDLLIQTEPGATSTPGEVQKADDLSCWEFVEETQSNSGITYQLYITGNYFENNTTVYNGCEECTAIHTIYLNFGSKNC